MVCPFFCACCNKVTSCACTRHRRALRPGAALPERATPLFDLDLIDAAGTAARRGRASRRCIRARICAPSCRRPLAEVAPGWVHPRLGSGLWMRWIAGGRGRGSGPAQGPPAGSIPLGYM